MNKQFSSRTSDSTQTDMELVQAALNGNKQALETLILRHQSYIYNIAWKMVLSPQDAEDVTQEVFIKVMTNLSSFEGRSSFRTWLYRIAVNYILAMKKRQLENIVSSFENYFDGLDEMPDHHLSLLEEQELQETITEVKLSCTAGMLLCLDREQRMIIILGDIFEIDHQLGAEIFGISPDNFRQKLSRARKDLYNWMNHRCGLVNTANPCRCPKKTKAFINAGWVDPQRLKFNAHYTKSIYEVVNKHTDSDCDKIEELHRSVFIEHPFQEPPSSKKIINEIIDNIFIKDLYKI